VDKAKIKTAKINHFGPFLSVHSPELKISSKLPKEKLLAKEKNNNLKRQFVFLSKLVVMSYIKRQSKKKSRRGFRLKLDTLISADVRETTW
jgi:hypothetical protein